jgi:hypothetical protein
MMFRRIRNALVPRARGRIDGELSVALKCNNLSRADLDEFIKRL